MRILADLSIGAVGYSGIPQDAKWLLRTLASIPKTKVDALVYDLRGNGNVATYPLKDHPLSIAILLGLMNVEPGRLDFTDGKLHKIYNKQKEFKMVRVPKMLRDIVWRIFLSAGLTGKDKRMLDKNVDYLVSTMTNHMLYYRVVRGVPQPEINTSEYDIAVFEDSRPVKVSKNTIKVIRYHDALPLVSADTFTQPEIGAPNHYFAIQECLEQGAYYVCNTEATARDLYTLFPQYADKITVIPYAISNNYLKNNVKTNKKFVRQIINLRQSPISGGVSTLDNNRFKYILAVSTIEPRKNWHALFDAYSLLLEKYPNMKIVIAGARGWKNKNIVEKMKTMHTQGKLFFVPNLHPEQLYHLMKNAEMLVYPSVAEGFGLPPIEAQACGIPVLTSDIAPHREAQGEASWYCDPYDVRDMSEKMIQILTNRRMRRIKIKKGLINAQRYSYERISGAWSNYLKRVLKKAALNSK